MIQAKDLEEKLTAQKRLAEERDAERRAKKLGLPYLDLISVKVPTEIKAMELVPEEEAKKALLSPLQLIKNQLVLAVFDSEKPETKVVLEKLKKNHELKIFVSSLAGLKHSWNYYQYITESKEISGKIEINEEKLKNLLDSIKTLEDITSQIKNFKDPYTSQVLEIILAGALALNASDIHLEPRETTSALRFRIDGLLHTAYDNFPVIIYRSLTTRIKLLSNLKLNIHDKPQDGRYTIDLKGRDIEIRTSVIPSEYGETIVMRLLDPTALKINLEELGFRKDDLEIIKDQLSRPNGLILNTGPTGSGKTTTLYAFLQYSFKPEIKIITIEDPIEYHLSGISQTQIDPDANYTFASGLRSILRQDPNVILVGEIRDKETAEIALNAALTGHLVFSTLHTNDAVGAIPRLIDLGAKNQILGPALTLVIAQRLVRKLCPYCRKEKKIDEALKNKIDEFLRALPGRINKKELEKISVYEAAGCEKCGKIGYRGRISIFELFAVNQKIQELIYKNPTEIELKDEVKREGMVTMQEDGILKTLSGITTFEEVERLTGPVPWLK